MAARPLVSVYDSKGNQVSQIAMPHVLLSPIRADVVQFVHTQMNKNARQAYAVSVEAGHQTSAESWGTGRAVSRIPRVRGSGTHRAGQGAFGNMCRSGRMFAPTKVWRKWHRKINTNQRRHAVASALAASAVPALVQARGHKIDNVVQVPLVVSDDAVKNMEKTSEARKLLEDLNAASDVDHAKQSRKLRRGKGKMRNRRYVQRRGPLVIYGEQGPLTRAFRNLPGVDMCQVSRLNLLQLAPGGHVGRFVIWTEDAFKQLDALYGTYKKAPTLKSSYRLNRPKMANADLTRIINSDAIQSQLRPAQAAGEQQVRKRNPLRNKNFMKRLNPYNEVAKQVQQKSYAERLDGPAAKKLKANRSQFYETLNAE